MTISIQRIAWTVAVAGGMLVFALTVQRPLRSLAGVAEQTTAEDRGKSPATAPTKTGNGTVSEEAAAKGSQAPDGFSPEKNQLLRKRSAAYRRAKQIIELGRKALKEGRYRRAKQLARLAESSRARFDESDPDHPARLRDEIAEAIRAELRKRDRASSEPNEVSASEATELLAKPVTTPAAPLPSPVVKRPDPPAVEKSAPVTKAKPVATPADPLPSPVVKRPDPPAVEKLVPAIQAATTQVTTAPSSKITIRANYDEVAAPRQPVQPPILVEPRAAEAAERESKQAPSKVVPAAASRPAAQPQEKQATPQKTLPPVRSNRPRPARRLSRGELAQKLLDDARQAIEQGDLDGAAALALRAKGLNVRGSANADGPDRVLRQIVELNRQASRGGKPLLSHRQPSEKKQGLPFLRGKSIPEFGRKDKDKKLSSGNGDSEQAKPAQPRTARPLGQLQPFTPRHPKPTFEGRKPLRIEADARQSSPETVPANTADWRSAPVTVAYRDVSTTSQSVPQRQTSPSAKPLRTTDAIQGTGAWTEGKDVSRAPVRQRLETWQASDSVTQHASAEEQIQDDFELQPPTPTPPLHVEVESPATYAPESASPEGSLQDGDSDDLPSLEEIPPLHVEPSREFTPVNVHGYEHPSQNGWYPNQTSHCSRCCKLSLWCKLVRFVHPTHRRIPVGLPENYNGLAGYSPTRWSRLPSPSPAEWSTPEPTSADEDSEEEPSGADEEEPSE